MMISLALLGTASAVRMHESTEVQANPMRKVINALERLQAEVEEEGEKDQKLFDKFVCFVEKVRKNGGEDVSAKGAEAEQAAHMAAENDALHAQLTQELADHKKDRSEAEKAVAESTAIREKERAEYEAEAGDSKKNIDALNKAITLISKGMNSFLQAPAAVKAGLKKAVQALSSTDEMDRETVMSFLSGTNPYGAYNAASGEIVGILKTMKDQMDKDLGGIVSAEEEAQATFNKLIAAKNAEIASATKAIEAKTVRQGEAAVAKTEFKNQASNAANEAAALTSLIANVDKEFAEKQANFNQRMSTRAEEGKAISEAIKILSDDDALEVFKKTLPSTDAPKVFLQMQGASRNEKRERAMKVVLSATKNKSVQTMLLMNMLKSKKVSFDKVLKMIDDMIALLGEEQTTDDEHRGTCINELDSASDEAKDLKRKLDNHVSNIEVKTDRSNVLKEELTALKKELSDLDNAVATATEQRKAENAEFSQSMIENNAAKQLIEKAKNRLNKFYNPALYKAPKKRELTDEEKIRQSLGEKIDDSAPVEYIAGTTQTVLAQQEPYGKAPETMTGTYKGKGQKSNSVIALLDMMVADIAKEMTESKSGEAQAQKDYEEFMAESKKNRAANLKSTNEATTGLANTNTRLAELADKKAMTETLLAENAQRTANLHTSCDFLINNFDVRKEARTTEVEGLKNAKAILNGANFS